ncbi:FadR/GntR family transcriptional regulator [Microbacterium sp. No. 7]|uniref:FadR/GntR family transcriptional regulator n=1 Tax=Microbacterium sp. No. 7 TaxID=1714373 RepID=UPI0006D189F8|nr:FCD domain-containing protein [Microbacterium sp. No. 7]ALJ20681.1 GntR family transcriptional regulator [Microbacterium sp. No. 7]
MNRRAARPLKTAIFVAQQIVADINRRGNIPGDRLPPERAMLEQYEVGRGTLRESLRFLELQGIIMLKPGPGGGPVVQAPDASGLATTLTLLMQFGGATLQTLIESRRGLEPLTARLAASRMTVAQRQSLTENLELMSAHIDDNESFLHYNRDFHIELAHGSANVIYGCVVDALAHLIDGHTVGVTYSEPRRRAVLDAHRRIHHAILNSDPDAAENAMALHIQEYMDYVVARHPSALDARIVWEL